MKKCSYEDCTKEADTLVYSRKLHKVIKTCYDHAQIVVDEGSPEYIEDCPNCGCLIPVN